MRRYYPTLVYFLEKLRHPLLLIVRLYWGWQFFQAGKGKFGNIEMVTGFFGSLGIPFPLLNAYLVASVETVCGLLLFLGLGARLAAIPLTITMVVAYLTAHRSAALGLFSDPKQFFAQEPFLFLFAAILVLIFGAGFFSLDRICRKFRIL